MYRFQVRAHTKPGEIIVLVGSVPALGMWNLEKGVPLQTNADRYPLWWVELDPNSFTSAHQKLEYQYVHIRAKGSTDWESKDNNRWVPIESIPAYPNLVIEDGTFGTIVPCAYGYFESPVSRAVLPKAAHGLKIVVLGSSVSLGCSAWMLRGWSWLLEQELHKQFGHQVINVSELGANVTVSIDRFNQVVTPHHPDIVIVALSLGNEGLATCAPYERRAVQRRFESGLQQLVKMIRAIGARPILGGVYPHSHYTPEHYWLLRESHQTMLTWNVPVLDWLSHLDNGEGKWKPDISFDPGHPNTEGHRLMFAAIPLSLFEVPQDKLAQDKQSPQSAQEVLVYRDQSGFHLFVRPEDKSLRIINPTPYLYRIHPSWTDLQQALQHIAALIPGIYTTDRPNSDAPLSFSVKGDRTIETIVEVPPGSELEYHATFHLFSPKSSQILFYDGQVGLLKEHDHRLRVINETNHEYNIHPMWKEVRSALKSMPIGVYKDIFAPELDFRTMIIGKDGLESRVKAPAKSSLIFAYHSPLTALHRIGIIPLGDRCAIRMLLYKMEYDGPAYPFDLTRTSVLGDVADMIENKFYDMWNPAYLCYNAQEKRMYHRKWSGLSFAHEVEEDDDVNNLYSAYERMRLRYTSRADRFWYTLKHANELLFIRTGQTDRNSVIDIIDKLTQKCEGKPFRFLLISLQDSSDFTAIPHTCHFCLDFNPDRMYEDLEYWLQCTETMRSIFTSLGISSKNLFWCPPKI